MNVSKFKLLRITTISHSLDLLLKGQLAYMKNNGFEVFIACAEDERAHAVAQRESATYLPIGLTRSITPLQDFKALLQTIQLIKKLKPNIVHTHSPKAGLIGMMAAWYCSVPVRIHTVAGLPLVEATGIKYKVLRWMEQLTYKCAHYVLPNSKVQKEYIVSSGLHKDNQYIQVIGKGSSNGINLDYFRKTPELTETAIALRAKYGIAEDAKVISFVGRLANYKGINELVSAFVQINHPNLYLMLIGPLEEINPLEPETLDALKNNKKIISVGHQEDIRPYVLTSELFAFPSYREGFPQSLMQACALEVPAIATDINGCNEILEHEVSGVLIPPKDTEALKIAILKYLEQPTLYQEYAQKALKNIQDNYDQKHVWGLIQQFYLDKINNSSK